MAVELKVAVDGILGREIKEVEGWMGTKLEVKGTTAGVVDSPPAGEDGLTKLVVGCEGKGIGIDFEGVGRGR